MNTPRPTVSLLEVPVEKLCIDCDRPLPAGPKRGAAKRCASCALAAGRWSLWEGYTRDGEQFVPVDCWCQRTTVWVRINDNRRGLTGTCGLDTCRRAA